MAKIKRVETEHTVMETGERASLFGVSADFPDLAELNLADIDENPHQARKVFDPETIAELAASIERHGLQQPIIVRRHDTDDGRFVLVAGERRLRAHHLLGRKSIFAIVSKRTSDTEILSLIENVQRQDLNALELAGGLAKLIANGGYTHEQAGEVVGMSPQLVSRILKVLALPAYILDEYPSVAQTVSRSMLMELIDIKDDSSLQALWKRAKAGLLKREDVRDEAKASKPQQASVNTDGHELRKLGNAVRSIKTNVLALEPLRGRLSKEHRDVLREMRQKIDNLLDGGA